MAVSDWSVAGGLCALALGMAELQPCQLPANSLCPGSGASTLTGRVCWTRFPLAAMRNAWDELGWGRGGKPRH